jgi:hypothetical protein
MSRKRWILAGAAVALVLVSGLAHARHAPDIFPVFALIKPSPVAGFLPAVADRAATDTPVPSAKVAVAGGSVSVRYSFDGGVQRPITDTNGRHELRQVTQNGGALRLVPQPGRGLALAFPDRCRLARERDCPRAILEGRREDDLNPGTRQFQYGASVRMTHGDLADGANVVQKGYSVGGMGQFKLQVDHRLGHPSCVLANGQRRIFRAEPWLDVADGRWHNLACHRNGDRLSLSVDGVERAAVRVPASLSIANAEPLRVGGKGLSNGNDQFAGEIDNVFVVIG